jgi:NAD(P)-dependent dehydrogenase (short-subunit alcohol dehydrogenase family)
MRNEGSVMAWRVAQMPDLTGRRAIVTGGSSGIGYEVARVLAARGAAVTMTSRDPARGVAAAGALGVGVVAEVLDLADLASVRHFSAAQAAHGPLDLLINNAGLMGFAQRHVTRDGFEMQLGTNHLGHFALTGLLLPALLAAPASRVVTVSSIAHRRGEIHFNDLQLERGYAGMRAYTQSKLANLMFALELQRRLTRAGASTLSIAAHPGVAATNLPSTMRDRGWLVGGTIGAVFQVIGQSAARGALPILLAATADVAGGTYWGPDGLREMRGRSAAAAISQQALDAAGAAELWHRSELLTKVSYLD